MTRTITPAEIKPGMTIRWTHNKVTYECPVMDRDGTDEDGGVLCHVSDMHSEYVDAEAGEVTVLSEPAPAQPEEPTEFGARVVVAGERALRIARGPWLTDGLERCTWDDLCEMGPVTVVPDQGWEVPDDTPEVPERIEEWPEDDIALRPYKWRDPDGDIWRCVDGWWRWGLGPWGDYHKPFGGPWDRVTDA